LGTVVIKGRPEAAGERQIMVGQPTRGTPWSWLRIAIVGAGVAGFVFWCGAMVTWWRIPDSHRDGLELMGPVLATGFLVAIVLPTLVLGVIGRWLPLAAILAVVVLIIVTDTLVPWFPWSWMPAPP
jgi:hypothetical protein